MLVGVDKDEKVLGVGRVLNNDWLDDAWVEVNWLAPMVEVKLLHVWGFEGFKAFKAFGRFGRLEGFENKDTGFISSAPIMVKLGLSEGGGARFAGFGRLFMSFAPSDSMSTYRVRFGDIVDSSAGITFIIVLTGVDGAG